MDTQPTETISMATRTQPFQVSLFKFDMWSSWLQNDIDKDRTVMDTINALVVVSAFIAGIQGQIIQFTMSLPRNRLGRSANFFAFSGLMLDIIGTFSGVVHALVLQRRINKSTAVLNFVTQTRAGTKATNQKGANEEEKLLGFGIEGRNALSQRMAWLEKEMSLNPESGENMVSLVARIIPNPVAPAIPLDRIGLPQPDHTPTIFMLESPFELGHTPLISMGLGVIALVISIVLFTAETTSLAGEVWMTCVVVLFTVMAFSLVPITYSTIKRRRHMTKTYLGE